MQRAYCAATLELHTESKHSKHQPIERTTLRTAPSHQITLPLSICTTQFLALVHRRRPPDVGMLAHTKKTARSTITTRPAGTVRRTAVFGNESGHACSHTHTHTNTHNAIVHYLRPLTFRTATPLPPPNRPAQPQIRDTATTLERTGQKTAQSAIRTSA